MLHTPCSSQPHQAEAKTRPGAAGVNFSPVSYSPLTASKERSGDDKSGKIVYTFGSAELTQKVVWESEGQLEITIKQIANNVEDKLLESEERYMFDAVDEKALISGVHFDDVSMAICSRAFTEDVDETDASSSTESGYEGDEFEKLSMVEKRSQAVVRCTGRIANDSTSDRLSAHSVILIGSSNDELESVPLNFTKISSAAVFPGQIVLVKGMNPDGRTFYLRQIFTERYWDAPRAPSHLTQPLRLLIASGPFAANNDLVCEPLQDLLAQCKQLKPDVLILIGPFVDINNSCVADGLLAESFDSYFHKLIDGVVTSLGEQVEILVVASQRDAHSSMVYPTHPYIMPNKPKNVTFLPDPCSVEICGVKFGISATDIVGHIAEEEFTKNVLPGDKVKRIVGQLINQKTFYPLNPPALGVNMDSSLTHRFARLQTVPNIFILPSDHKCFIRDIGGVVAINPGRAVNAGSGTFARLVITTPEDGATPKDYMACRIMKI
ncbi:DNA polymerase alpha subunit B [Sergentomyia squamirostris]